MHHEISVKDVKERKHKGELIYAVRPLSPLWVVIPIWVVIPRRVITYYVVGWRGLSRSAFSAFQTSPTASRQRTGGSAYTGPYTGRNFESNTPYRHRAISSACLNRAGARSLKVVLVPAGS